MRRLLKAALVKFDLWFSSEWGVYQTVLGTLILVVLEQMLHLDPHGFWLLYWLTVYSAVTQPALAHTGREQMEKLQFLEQTQLHQIEQLRALIEQAGYEHPRS